MRSQLQRSIPNRGWRPGLHRLFPRAALGYFPFAPGGAITGGLCASDSYDTDRCGRDDRVTAVDGSDASVVDVAGSRGGYADCGDDTENRDGDC